MGIAGLGTYNSTSFYYATSYKSKNSNVEKEPSYDFLPEETGSAQTESLPSKTTDGAVQTAYSRCITANIRTEELYASKSSDGELIYSYKASEQSFKIWINSDGDKKTYSIEGIDKDGQSFTKEFDPYDVDPEDADFPEFAALCMYIRDTDETSDMLANEYFATENILEKCDYMEKMQGFSSSGIFEKTQSMMDNLNKLMATLEQIVGIKNDFNSMYEPFLSEYMIEDVDLSDYPDIAGAISEELSSESVKEAEQEEIVTPLGMGFALAGNMGYGMSASLVEKPGNDDTIIRVKLATGSGDEIIDVNLSEFDPTNATPVEMFAYCQYKDSIGEGVDSKWGSWNAMKHISSPYDGFNFGTLDNIMNQKIDWSDKLSQSQTSWVDPKTDEVIMSASDLLKLLEDANKITSKDLKEEKDWREISDEEWDKMLEGIDKYIDAFKERLKQMKEKQEEAARKAAMEADPGMKAIAASEAALAAANGFGEGTSSEEESDEAIPNEDGTKREKNWTKKLDTDDQTILRTAKAAQEAEKTALSKFQEVQITDNTTVGVSSAGGVTECASLEEDENKDRIWTITAFTIEGISSQRCQNGNILDSWEIKYNNPDDANRVLDVINSFDKDANLVFAGSKTFWENFLKNNLNVDSIFAAHGDVFDNTSKFSPTEE